MTQKTKKAPTHEIYNVVGDGKNSRWDKIGVGFENHDGKGINLFINYKPLIDGQLIVREIKKEEADNEASK